MRSGSLLSDSPSIDMFYLCNQRCCLDWTGNKLPLHWKARTLAHPSCTVDAASRVLHQWLWCCQRTSCRLKFVLSFSIRRRSEDCQVHHAALWTCSQARWMRRLSLKTVALGLFGCRTGRRFLVMMILYTVVNGCDMLIVCTMFMDKSWVKSLQRSKFQNKTALLLLVLSPECEWDWVFKQYPWAR